MGNSIKELVRKIKESLFGKQDEPAIPTESISTQGLSDDSERIQTSPPSSSHQPSVSDPLAKDSKTSKATSDGRRPYFIQIGFDFGTAYSKCIIRNVGADRATIYIPESGRDPSLPFLMPSVVNQADRNFACGNGNGGFYQDGSLTFLKMALASYSTGKLDDSSIQVYRKQAEMVGLDTEKYVRCACLMYLGFWFGQIDTELRKRFPGLYEHEKDRVYVNVAIPVGHSSEKKLSAAFNDVVGKAWTNRERFADQTRLSMDVLLEMNGDCKPTAKDSALEWYLYPEVSANVQSYVRSRTSKPGLYLFVDTGAGTVDQSVFIYQQPGEHSSDRSEKLYYLSAQVLNLGSNKIEMEAFQRNNSGETISMEELRKLKESGIPHHIIDPARDQIKCQVTKRTITVLARAKVDKLNLPQQLESIELIFGGGGNCEHPYESGVRDAFKSEIFNFQGTYKNKSFTPDSIGIPLPNDLEFPAGADQHKWFKRLSVAYGLSFPEYDLSKFVLPDYVPNAKPVLPSEPPGVEYIDKDMV